MVAVIVIVMVMVMVTVTVTVEVESMMKQINSSNFSNFEPQSFTVIRTKLVYLLGGLLLAFSSAALGAECKTMMCDKREIRLEHARELLGKFYAQSMVQSGESVTKMDGLVYKWTKDRLPRKFKKDYKKIAQAIIDESYAHEFDPIFLMSVIETESGFHPERRGLDGEIGLMQILPSTGKWIAEKSGISWNGKKSLRNPVENIKLGAAYFCYLRDRFKLHARLYLAAYNMGQRNVDEAFSKKIWPRDYPGRVMKNYVQFYEEIRNGKKVKTASGSVAVNRRSKDS